jgi:DNA-binding response OmpR family regulator
VPARLSSLSKRLRDEGFLVFEAGSAAQCLSLSATYKPDAVVLECGFLRVDLENLAAYITHLSRETVVVLTVNRASDWPRCPECVRAIAEHSDLDSILDVLRRS